VPGDEEQVGMVAVHWSPEACIADTQASEGGLSKIMSAATNVRNAPLRTTVVVYKYLWIRRQLMTLVVLSVFCVLPFYDIGLFGANL